MNAGFAYARLLNFTIAFEPEGEEKVKHEKNNARMFDTLAKMGHPVAANYVADEFYVFSRNNIQEVSGFSYDEYFEQVEKYYRIAIHGGVRSHQHLAMLLIIGKEPHQDKERSTDRSIAAFKKTQSFARQEEAMQLFKTIAEKGSIDGAAQLAEGYMHGTGVAKNVIEAYAWSKLAVTRGHIYMVEGNAVWACEQFLESSPPLKSEEKVEAENLFEKRNKIIPSDVDYRKWRDEIPAV